MLFGFFFLYAVVRGLAKSSVVIEYRSQKSLNRQSFSEKFRKYWKNKQFFKTKLKKYVNICIYKFGNRNFVLMKRIYILHCLTLRNITKIYKWYQT